MFCYDRQEPNPLRLYYNYWNDDCHTVQFHIRYGGFEVDVIWAIFGIIMIASGVHLLKKSV